MFSFVLLEYLIVALIRFVLLVLLFNFIMHCIVSIVVVAFEIKLSYLILESSTEDKLYLGNPRRWWTDDIKQLMSKNHYIKGLVDGRRNSWRWSIRKMVISCWTVKEDDWPTLYHLRCSCCWLQPCINAPPGDSSQSTLTAAELGNTYQQLHNSLTIICRCNRK